MSVIEIDESDLLDADAKIKEALRLICRAKGKAVVVTAKTSLPKGKDKQK